MPPALPLKVLVVVPERTGKTTLVNLLADFSSEPSAEYAPTAGARILEADRTVDAGGMGHAYPIALELWDVSGARKYENCWPAVQKDADGVLIVCSPATLADAEFWYARFGASMHVSQVLVLEHRAAGTKPVKSRLPESMEKVTLARTSMDPAENEAIKTEFMRFVAALAIAKLDRMAA